MRMLVLGLTFLCLLSGCSGPSWERVLTGGKGNTPYGICFIDGSRGWIAGSERGTSWIILRTEDGGQSWSELASLSPETSDKGQFELTDVGFLENGRGILVGRRGTVFESEDGTTWKRTYNGQPFEPINALDVVGNRAWAAGANGVLLRNSNGVWVRVTALGPDALTPCYDIDFVDAENGWVVGRGRSLYRSVDGGSRWTKVKLPDAPEELSVVSFVSPERGWVGGRSGLILHTEDGGRTWVEQSTGNGENVQSLRFLDEQRGWAVTRREVLRTLDGGKTWELSARLEVEQLETCYFSDFGHGWVAGRDSQMQLGVWRYQER